MTEFHVVRIMLLLRLCGKNSKIEGLTKLAKLDFFIRYPDFFFQVSEQSNPKDQVSGVESNMVRHFYGPWDKRYYDLLAYMEARELIRVTRKSSKTVCFELSPTGIDLADHLLKSEQFGRLVAHIKQVGVTFSSYTGNRLKDLIYSKFATEIAEKPMGEIID